MIGREPCQENSSHRTAPGGAANLRGPPLKPDEVRGQGILSGISHGTEMNLYRGTSAFADHEFDMDLRLFVPRKAPRPQGRSATSGLGGSRRSARTCIISNPATSSTC